MIEHRINEDAVNWAVDGSPATRAEALSALTNRPLLVLLHGYGSFEGDLIGLAPQLPMHFVCASPRALFEAPAPVVNGYAWWAIDPNADEATRQARAPKEFIGSDQHAAAVAVLEWINALHTEVANTQNPQGISHVAVMGFSQGGGLVTSLLRLQPERFSCGVNCSGTIAPGAFAGDAALAEHRPPLFWARDEADPIMTEERAAPMKAWAPLHTRLESKLYPNIGHSISAEEVSDISDFLNSNVTTSVEVTA